MIWTRQARVLHRISQGAVWIGFAHISLPREVGLICSSRQQTRVWGCRTGYNVSMDPTRYQLALETSCRPGSISLGRGDQLLASVDLPDPHRAPRQPGNRLDLMASIDQLIQQYHATPEQISDVYLSIGPGSFTGLRTAVTTAKALAYTLGARLVAVPTVGAIALNVPVPAPIPQKTSSFDHLAVCLNLKRDSMYVGLFERNPNDQRWVLSQPPAIWALDPLLHTAPRPLAIVGDPLPRQLLDTPVDGVTLLEAPLAIPRSEAVWQIGRAMARQGQTTDPFKLSPLYARPPEAEELWNQRHAPPAPAANLEPTPAGNTLP